MEPVGDGSWVLPGKGQNQSVNLRFGGPTMCQAVKSEASASRMLNAEDNLGIASSSEVPGFLSLSSGTATDQFG